MSWLTGTAKICHTSRLPKGARPEQAVRLLLQDHAFFLGCDPHLVKFEAIEEQETPALPESVKPLGATRSYRVHDLVHTLPAGLWDSNVESTYEMTDVEDGVFVRIRSPMSVVMDTLWTVREVKGSDGSSTSASTSASASASEGEGEGEGEEKQFELVEDVEIRCSRLLVGTVKGLCEGGWHKIHAKMLDRLEKSGEGEAETKN